MAIVVTSLGASQSKSGSANIINPTDWSSGDVIIVIASSDNAITESSDSTALYYNHDPSPASYDQLASDVIATNSGNAVCSILRIEATENTADATSHGIAVLDSGGDSIAITAYKVTGLAATPLDKTSTGTGSSQNAASSVAAPLAQADELIVGGSAVEDEVDDAHGTITDNPDYGYLADNIQFDATNGQGDASNMQAHSAASITAVATPPEAAGWTFGDTGHDSKTDWASSIATYKAVAAAGGPTGVKTINDVAIASVKTINDVAIASVKTINDAV